jgi:serine/threonine-protein kinase PpkA
MTSLAMPASLAWRSLAAPLRGAQRLDAAPRIPGYRVLREIGTGRRSSAWLARELAGDREVVLKVQPASASTLHREWSVAAQVAGRHVLQVHGHGRAGGWDYLVMEHASGGDLAGRMRAGLAAAEALDLLAQCARGLAALHRAGLVHRDVKPANFLLRADGSVVLADFGLAVPAGRPDASFSQGAVVGTPRYVAPEQLEGAPAAPAADVYGLGVLLFEMLCGRPPFGGETLMEILSQHLVAPPPRLAAAHARLQPVADALLAKEPAARPADAIEVLGLLARGGDRDPE